MTPLISFPLSLGLLNAVLAVPCLLCGSIVITGCLTLIPGNPFMLLYLIFGAVFFLGGAVGLLKAFMKVRLTPDGITLTLLGRTFRQYPAQQLQTFALVQRGLAKSQTTHLCISTRTVDELAAIQDQKRRADDRTRRSAALRRRTTWQRAFAGDYLRKKTGTILLTLPGRDLFWLNFSLETMGLLRLVYPQVPWLIAPEAQSTPVRYSGDSDPTTAVFPDPKRPLVFDKNGAALMKKGQRRELLAGDRIRTIVRAEQLCGGGGYYEKYLLLTSLPPEELIREHEAAIRRWRGSNTLDTLRQLPGWQLLALDQACGARMPLFDPSGKGNKLVSVLWFPAREDALRQLYPQAAFFDCTNESLFHAVFADPDAQILRP